LLGGKLHSLDGTKMLRDFQGKRVAPHPERDVVAVWNGAGIALRRFSDGAAIETLPPVSHGAPLSNFLGPGPTANPDPVLRYDLAAGKVFVGFLQMGYWITPQTKLGELSPLRWLDVPARTAATIGEA